MHNWGPTEAKRLALETLDKEFQERDRILRRELFFANFVYYGVTFLAYGSVICLGLFVGSL